MYIPSELANQSQQSLILLNVRTAYYDRRHTTTTYTLKQTVAKTRSQLNRRLADGKKLPFPPFGAQWYAGCTTLVIGNAVKAGVRK